MANPPAKAQTKNVQKQQQHVRYYRSSGKVTLVNKGVRKSEKSSNPVVASRPRSGPKKASPRLDEKPKINFIKKNYTSPQEESLFKKEWKDFSKMVAATKEFPVIAWPGWESAYPELIAKNVQLYRMIQLMKTVRKQTDEGFKEYATNEEVLGYLSTMSLGGPFERDLYEITMYLYNKVMPKDKIPADLEVITALNDQQKSLLKRLKRSIRQSQWKAFNQKEKEDSQ